MVPAPFIVLLDANVLFPFSLRDTLPRAAAAGFYQVQWSSQILDEMVRNLVATGIIPEEKARRLRVIMKREFPEVEAAGYLTRAGALQRRSAFNTDRCFGGKPWPDASMWSFDRFNDVGRIAVAINLRYPR